MLIDKIREDRDIARKNKDSDKVILLGTLIGEIERNPNKDFSDVAVIASVKKFLNNYDSFGYKTPEIRKEIKIISSYLPRQLSREELVSLKEADNFASIKDWMAYLKNNHAGLYDGKMASEVFK